MASLPEGHGSGDRRRREAAARWAAETADTVREVAFWTAILLGVLLPAVVVLGLTPAEVAGLLGLEVGALVVGHGHRRHE